jgi:hypothetical protein
LADRSKEFCRSLFGQRLRTKAALKHGPSKSRITKDYPAMRMDRGQRKIVHRNTRLFSVIWACELSDGDLQNPQYMLMNPGALAFAAAGDIQNSIERLQRDSQEVCVSLDIREVVEPDVPLSQPLTLIQCETTSRAQRRSGKNHCEVRFL